MSDQKQNALLDYFNGLHMKDIVLHTFDDLLDGQAFSTLLLQLFAHFFRILMISIHIVKQITIKWRGLLLSSRYVHSKEHCSKFEEYICKIFKERSSIRGYTNFRWNSTIISLTHLPIHLSSTVLSLLNHLFRLNTPQSKLSPYLNFFSMSVATFLSIHLKMNTSILSYHWITMIKLTSKFSSNNKAIPSQRMLYHHHHPHHPQKAQRSRKNHKR